MTGHLFNNAEISQTEKEDVLKVFGIDFDEKVVRDIIPELKKGGATGIVEYPLSKVIP